MGFLSYSSGVQYAPHPVDLESVVIDGPFRELVSNIASKAHENWVAERIKEGKTISELPDLKLWNELTDVQKTSSLDSAEQAVKLLMHDFPLLDMINGDISFDRSKIIVAVAENAHEVWARQRMDAGCSYGETRDNEAKKHPMLKPYSELPDSEKAYARAYGEIVFDEIQRMVLERKEKLDFADRWGIRVDSREFNELYKLAGEFDLLPVQQRLDLVNDVISYSGQKDELVELREDLLREKKVLRGISEDLSGMVRAFIPSKLDLGLDSMRALNREFKSARLGQSAKVPSRSRLRT